MRPRGARHDTAARGRRRLDRHAALSGRSPHAWALRRTRRSAHWPCCARRASSRRCQRRRGSGEFGSSAYRLTIDADVLSRPPRTSLADQPIRSRRLAPKPPAASKALVAARASSSSSFRSPEESPCSSSRVVHQQSSKSVQTSARERARVVGGSMLRVTTLHASSAAATAAYYAQYLTAAPGEVPGVWSGRQAAGLGTVGPGRGRGVGVVVVGP